MTRATDLERAPFASRWLLAPMVGLFVVTFVVPQLFVVTRSLRPRLGMGLVGDGWTLASYAAIVGDTYYLAILARTAWFGVLVTALTLTLGYPLAFSLARSRSRWRGLLLALVLAPLFTSIVIRALGWMVLLGSNGPVNRTLLALGVIDEPVQLLYDLPGTVLGTAHALLPFMVLVLVGVVEKIDRSLEEAAADLGASRARTLARVVLPLSLPGVVAGSLLVFSMAVSVFTTPAMLGGRKLTVVAIAIEQQMRSTLDYPLGSALSVVLLGCTVALALLVQRVAGARPWSAQ